MARDSGLDLMGERLFYSAETAANDAILLPPLMRTFEVASSRKNPGAGFGQKPTWYGADDVNERVWTYIRNHHSRKTTPFESTNVKPGKTSDPELRRKVEKAAVAHATSYFNTLHGRNVVTSVEFSAKGWDLEVCAASELLLIEVKGLYGTELICELTPNEYEKMMLPEHRQKYVVYVVNNALAEPPAAPVASIFKYSTGRKWKTDDGRELVITPKTGAILSCE